MAYCRWPVYLYKTREDVYGLIFPRGPNNREEPSVVHIPNHVELLALSLSFLYNEHPQLLSEDGRKKWTEDIERVNPPPLTEEEKRILIGE
jgi:hypothetical protein